MKILKINIGSFPRKNEGNQCSQQEFPGVAEIILAVKEVIGQYCHGQHAADQDNEVLGMVGRYSYCLAHYLFTN